MPEPEYRSNYWHDAPAKASFIDLTKTIHGLDLTLWDSAGFWDENFAPFSFFVDGQIVSSVCVFLLPMRINGEDRRVPQISSVATVEAHRGQGLNRELTRRALEWCAAQNAGGFSFLFADDDAFGFYEKCGFRLSRQSRIRTAAKPNQSDKKARKLDVTQSADLRLIERIARNRVPVSDKIGAAYSNLLMFHVLHTVRDCVFLLPDGKSLVCANVSENVLHLHDVIAAEIPPLAEVLSAIPFGEFDRVEFGFMPDKFVDTFEAEIDDSDGTHLMGDFPWDETYIRFPFTSHA